MTLARSLFYRIAYATGRTPWDSSGDPPEVDTPVLRAVAGEETGDPPYGMALDLGCGRGRYTVALAARGWQVTGVDAVPKAVRASQANAARRGLSAILLRGSVTALPAAVGSGYRLLLDMGCLHGLSDDERVAEVREQERVAAPGALLVLFAFEPSSGPGPRGITPAQVADLYAGWDQVGQQRLDMAGARGAPRHLIPHLYQVRRPADDSE